MLPQVGRYPHTSSAFDRCHPHSERSAAAGVTNLLRTPSAVIDVMRPDGNAGPAVHPQSRRGAASEHPDLAGPRSRLLPSAPFFLDWSRIGGTSRPGVLTVMALDKATVRRIGKLARIRLDEDELEPLGIELGRILEWIEQLNEIDTADVPAMTGVEAQALRRRADEITDGRAPEAVLANAPDAVSGFFVVPKVVE